MVKWPFGGGKDDVGLLVSTRQTLALLQDVGTQATTKSVDSLQKLTKAPVQVKGAGVAVVPRRHLRAVLAAATDAKTLATMTLNGDAGFGALALGDVASYRLVDLLLGAKLGTTTRMGELEESAIAETANIALNQMVTAMSELTQTSFKTGVPQTSFAANVTLDKHIASAPVALDHALVLETPFEEPTSQVRGTMILVLFTSR